MKRSNRLVILVGVLLAVLAFVGIVILLNNPSGPPPTEQTVTVMIAKADIAIGDALTPDLVTAQQVNPADVVGTAIGNPSQLGGQPALVNIPANSQVPREAFAGGRTTTCISCQLESGEKAIAFQVDRVTGIDFLVQTGDHIDIVLGTQLQVLQPTTDTVDNPPAEQRFEVIPGLENARSVKTILQDKRVLYVSATRTLSSAVQATPSPGQQAPAAPEAQAIENVIIVFAGTDQDAEVIKFAQNDLSEVGKLTAVLRSTQDTDNEKTTGMTIDQLVKDYGIPIPNLVTQLGRGRNR